jgi:hypothetical protein
MSQCSIRRFPAVGFLFQGYAFRALRGEMM